jgi:hypothetical protein
VDEMNREETKEIKPDPLVGKIAIKKDGKCQGFVVIDVDGIYRVNTFYCSTITDLYDEFYIEGKDF